MKNGETPDPNVIHPIAGDTLESMALEIIARAAAIIETDCGKMVYKPRNCLADVRTRIFAKKYFPGRYPRRRCCPVLQMRSGFPFGRVPCCPGR